MTEVLVDLRRPNADGELVEVQGSAQWRPTRRRDDGSVVVLPQAFEHTARTPVTVTVAATGPDWCWEVTERTTRGITRYVAVPASDAVIPYTALTDVDPASFEPTAEPDPAWWAALEAGAYGVAAAVDPDHPDSLLIRFPVWRRWPSDAHSIAIPILTGVTP